MADAKVLRRLVRRLRPTQLTMSLYEAHDVEPTPATTSAGPIVHATAGTPSGRPGLDHRLVRGRECFYVEQDGKLVHESWVLPTVWSLRAFGVRRGPVIGECRTVEAWRGNRIYSDVLRHACALLLLRMDVDTVWVLVDPDNLPSVAGILRAGFTPVATIRAWRLFGLIVRSSRR